MRTAFSMGLLAWGFVSAVWAGDSFTVPLYDPVTGQDVPAAGQPTFTVTPVDTPTATFTPSATNTPGPSATPVASEAPLKAPQWSDVKTVPQDIPVNPKISPWMSLIGLGLDIPGSSHFDQAYALGFDLDLGTGYRLDDQWSLWVNLSLGQFDSKNDTLTQNNNFMIIEAALWLKFRLIDADFSPYFFLGPGLAYGENRSNQAIQYDPVTGFYDIPVNEYEIDWLAEAGAGLDLRVGDGIHFYLQGRLISDFVSPSFAAYASKDSPVLLIPVEFGMLFGY
jgi:hypothetical protein